MQEKSTVSDMRLWDLLFGKTSNIYSSEERDPDTSHQSPKLTIFHERLVFHAQPHKLMET